MSELGPEAQAVVEAGRAGDDPTARDRARVRAALMTAIAAGGAGVAAVVGEGAAAAGAVKGVTTVGVLGALGWGWQAAVFGLATLGAMGTTVAVMHVRGDAPSSMAASSVQVPVPRAVPVSPALEAPAALPAAASAEAQRSPPSAVAPAAHGSSLSHHGADEGEPRVPAASAPAAAPSPLPVDPLVAETRELGEAHGALKDGDPARALALLDQQATTYAGGQLREEREAARILALCKLGRADEARALAAGFLTKNPRSVLADRVRAACPAGAAH